MPPKITKTPTPIQEKAIPHLLQGRDLLGLAQTGTGKTAAFALPLLQLLSGQQVKTNPRTARTLILAPTRELGVQIADAIKTYGRHLKVTSALFMGGVAYGNQVRAISRGVDILVATPGRLLDHVSQGTVNLSETRFFVIDEADRMLDMGFIRDVRKLMKLLPRTKQSILFSATMPKEIESLAAEILHDPIRVTIPAKTVAVESIDQRVHHVSSGNKQAMLARLLDQPEFGRVIVFTRTKHAANRVAERLLKSGVPTEAIHGNKSQAARQKALENLRNGKVRVLVATDILARGIDVDSVSHVINYRIAQRPGRLCSPDRPDGARGERRRGYLLLRRKRTRQPAQHRALSRTDAYARAWQRNRRLRSRFPRARCVETSYKARRRRQSLAAPRFCGHKDAVA